jgi:sec-independent protein translocase protein TatA
VLQPRARRACDNRRVPFGIGQWELIALAVVLVLLFGSARLPRMARDLGRGVRELKETVADIDPRPAPPREPEPRSREAAAKASPPPDERG